MNDLDNLVVVSSVRWLAEDFAAPGIINVIPQMGFDLPRVDFTRTAWWCPGNYVARAEATGITLPLLSAGPLWVGSLPDKWLRREVYSARFEYLAESFSGGFIKPSEIKVGKFPAKLYESSARESFIHDFEESGLDPMSWLTVSEPMEYRREYRCFVSGDSVTAVSPYLLDGVTWDGFAPDTDMTGCKEARDFTTALLNELSEELRPPGFVIDVGLDSSCEWSVIEANASWSSNPYHADSSGVIESILSAHDIKGEHTEWSWEVDPYHRKHARPLYWKEM